MIAIDILGLSLIDIVFIILYFVVVLWTGFRAMKRIRNTEDYFLAGRRFGRSIQTFAAFGQGTSAESAVTTTTMVSTNGAAGIGMGLVNGIIGMPMYWMTTMWYRRMRYLSLAEFFTERYNSKAMAGFYARMRTPVTADHDLNAAKVAKTREDPSRCDHLKLFPGSKWEFRKWTRNDWRSQGMMLVATTGLVVLLWLLVNLGK